MFYALLYKRANQVLNKSII